MIAIRGVTPEVDADCARFIDAHRVMMRQIAGFTA